MKDVWHVVSHSEVAMWTRELDEVSRARVHLLVSMLEMHGPRLGRPLVDSIHGSQMANLKELRTGSLRILFAFDPERTGVLLVGGDKRKKWQEWYRMAIPLAETRFERWMHERDGGSPRSS